MEKRIKMLLLKYLETDGNIANLEKAGYSYAMIAREYSKLINEELIIPNENLRFVLSEKGLEELDKLISESRDKKEWTIEPYAKYKVDKMSKYDIYIE